MLVKFPLLPEGQDKMKDKKGQTKPEIRFHYEKKAIKVQSEREELKMSHWECIKLRHHCGLGLFFQWVKRGPQKVTVKRSFPSPSWAGSK